MPIENHAELRELLDELDLPFLIREDRGHGQPAYFVERWSDLERVPIRRFAHPIAVEYIDVQSPTDGLYRKYRYLVAGDQGVTRHLMCGTHWEVRPGNRRIDTSTREEELAYLNAPEPNYEALHSLGGFWGLMSLRLTTAMIGKASWSSGRPTRTLT